MLKKQSRIAKKNQLRIIGGTWRGRKLDFPDLPGLRPTSDRIRETLFNWLQVDIAGAVCLDLFAGSGALGIEALSRGAKRVVFVDSEKLAVEYITNNTKILPAENAEFVLSSAKSYIGSTAKNESYDLVFLDPPFGQNLLTDCLLELVESHICKPDAKVYVETEVPLDEKNLPVNWQKLKAKKAGKVYYYLICLTS